MPITFVNCFEVPSGREDEFLTLWTEVNRYMRSRPGYMYHRLHRAKAPDARFRFINIAGWESLEHFTAAHGAGFRELVNKPVWKDFPSTPTVCDLVSEGSASEPPLSAG